jgi:hypothetical protein
MKVQLTLTPFEGKRLIAKGVYCMENVQYAYKNGILIIAASTTTGNVSEELMGKRYLIKECLLQVLSQKMVQVLLLRTVGTNIMSLMRAS